MLDTLILYAILTGATIPFLVILRWWIARDPETVEALERVRTSWDAVVMAYAEALGIRWLLDRLEAFLARCDR